MLSNLGSVQLPPALEEGIEGMHFDLSPNHVMKKACGVLSFKNQLIVSFTSVIENRELERTFFTHLTSRGIPITLEEF